MHGLPFAGMTLDTPSSTGLYQTALNQLNSWSTEQAEYEFDQNQADSDGDGFSNLFERALPWTP